MIRGENKQIFVVVVAQHHAADSKRPPIPVIPPRTKHVVNCYSCIFDVKIEGNRMNIRIQKKIKSQKNGKYAKTRGSQKFHAIDSIYYRGDLVILPVKQELF
jgi:hypothetical protein